MTTNDSINRLREVPVKQLVFSNSDGPYRERRVYDGSKISLDL
jgi:hypothetical protein